MQLSIEIWDGENVKRKRWAYDLCLKAGTELTVVEVKRKTHPTRNKSESGKGQFCIVDIKQTFMAGKQYFYRSSKSDAEQGQVLEDWILRMLSSRNTMRVTNVILGCQVATLTQHI